MTRRQILTAIIAGVYEHVGRYRITDQDMNGFIAASKLFDNLAIAEKTNPRIYIRQFISEFGAALDGAGTIEEKIRAVVNE